MSACPGMKRRQGALARFVGDRLASGALRPDSLLGRAAIWAVSAPVRWKRHRILFRDGYYRLSDLPPALGFVPGAARRELAGKPRPILLSALGLGEMLNVLPLLEDPAARRIVSEQCGAEDRCLGMIAALGM